VPEGYPDSSPSRAQGGRRPRQVGPVGQRAEEEKERRAGARGGLGRGELLGHADGKEGKERRSAGP
jgi:hypothetical protein